MFSAVFLNTILMVFCLGIRYNKEYSRAPISADSVSKVHRGPKKN
jgi:hypothetical protein